jgi:type II secretory pathway pseudopilin PulG
MNMSSIRWKWIGLVVVIVVVVVGAVILILRSGSDASTNTTQNVAAGSDASTTVTNSAPGGNGVATASPAPHPAGNSGQNIPALPGPAITIHLITPISGNAWTIGGTNSIAWDNPADITGEIDLVNASTKAFVGVILSETGPKQTSYTWDARSIALARYSADIKDVVPGVYSIRIHFDGNGLGSLVSGPITISN